MSKVTDIVQPIEGNGKAYGCFSIPTSTADKRGADDDDTDMLCRSCPALNSATKRTAVNRQRTKPRFMSKGARVTTTNAVGDVKVE